MTEIRRHPITGDPIVFAPERAARPRAFAGGTDDARCPFCPGHESDTPPEILRIGEPWRARVFPNKYPPLPAAQVIVESAEHGAAFDQLENAEEIVRLYADRARAHDDAAYVAIFRNEGARAGASIPHLHSQVVPLPFVPPRVARELAAFASAPECPLCAAIDDHRRDGLIIRETETFVAIAPRASAMAYQQWILPKRHVPAITVLDDAELADLAQLLRDASRAMRRISDAHNSALMNFPQGAHFYVETFPRVTTLAGLELATGTFVEIIDPAAAVARLR